MNDNNEAVNIRGILEHLLKSQNLAVLATHNHGQPYTSLVAFAGSEELKALYFVTGQATRKHANLTGDPRAAMMIDNRSNTPADIADAMAATATGSVDMLSENERVKFLNIYLQKHPHLAEFAKSPSTRLIRLNVLCYSGVSRFQNVVELHMEK